MPLETTRWDAADHLASDEAITAYLDAAFEDGDPALITAALGDVARARGLAHVAHEAGLDREGLSRSLSGEGSPDLGTVLRVLKALGLRLSAEPSRASL